MRYRYLTKKFNSLNEAKEHFQLNAEAHLREEFLKHSVGDSSTYDLNSVMIVQTLGN